jgi:hypothetical protein
MVTRIGGTRPPRLYIEERMAAIPGMNRKRLAERMGVAQGTITKKLKEPGKIDGVWLERFREALGLDSVEDLFRHPSAPTQDELLRGLSEDEQNQVTQYANFLRSKKAG